jgi:hypothetical protein
MSAEQVEEWLHSDKGKHFAKADGGVAGFSDDGIHDPERDDDERKKRQQIAEMQAMQGPKASGGAVDQAMSIVRSSVFGHSKEPHAERSSHRKGYAFGGMDNPPYFARQEAREENAPDSYGLMASGVPGRTDRHPIDVAAGTYVLPADVVSGLGEGNTMAGAAVIDKMLHSMPYGIQPPNARGHGGERIPRPPTPYRPPAIKEEQLAQGGSAEGRQDGKVPIIIAGGEFLIDPSRVAYHKMLGAGDANNKDPKHFQAALTRGHDILDAFVKHARSKHIKDLKGLPGPSK